MCSTSPLDVSKWGGKVWHCLPPEYLMLKSFNTQPTLSVTMGIQVIMQQERLTQLWPPGSADSPNLIWSNFLRAVCQTGLLKLEMYQDHFTARHDAWHQHSVKRIHPNAWRSSGREVYSTFTSTLITCGLTEDPWETAVPFSTPLPTFAPPPGSWLNNCPQTTGSTVFVRPSPASGLWLRGTVLGAGLFRQMQYFCNPKPLCVACTHENHGPWDSAAVNLLLHQPSNFLSAWLAWWPWRQCYPIRALVSTSPQRIGRDYWAAAAVRQALAPTFFRLVVIC